MKIMNMYGINLLILCKKDDSPAPTFVVYNSLHECMLDDTTILDE